LITGYFHWSVIFFVNVPIGLAGSVPRVPASARLPRQGDSAVDIVGLILFSSGIALLSYVLEVFGEHTLSGREVLGTYRHQRALLAGYGLHATHTAHPLLRLTLFRIRTFRAAVSGSFVTRLGIGGIPFPVSAALPGGPRLYSDSIRPSHDAASPRRHEPENDHAAILARFGYRGVLISNTVMLGLLMLLFATIGAGTPMWLIVAQAFSFGFFTSLQYTSMNTLVFADVNESQAASASTIASTMQQMSISFGVASASLVTAIFIPDRFHTSAAQMIHGIHEAFLILGALTILSAIVFRELHGNDGSAVSQHKAILPTG
jgi:hypothetical protein